MGLGFLSPRGLFLESHAGSLRVVHDTRHRSFWLVRRISSMSTVKDGGRNDRLSWSKRAEHRLQEELKEIALKRCDDSVAKFAACAKEKGMLVVFSCREQNKLMNECLNKHTNKDSFERYKMERELELHRAGLAEQSSG